MVDINTVCVIIYTSQEEDYNIFAFKRSKTQEPAITPRSCSNCLIKENNMTNILENIVQVGDIELANISMEDFLPLPPIYNQRHSAGRVNKMKQTFDSAYMNNKAESLSMIALGIAENDIVDPESGAKLKKGDITIVDSCTRQHYWKLYPETQKHHSNGLTAIIHRLYSHEDVDAAYYPYNNAKSSENKAELIQGLNRKHGLDGRLKQTVFANGGFGSALLYASTNPLEPKERKDIFEQYDMSFDALKVVDNIPKGSANGITKPAIKSIKSQAIIGACLLALRNHPGNVNLLDFISRLSTITFDELTNIMQNTKQADPVEMVALEYSGFSQSRKGLDPSKRDLGWINGTAGSTKMADIRPQMDFLLFQISKYINSPNKKIDILSVQPGQWGKEWETWYEENASEHEEAQYE